MAKKTANKFGYKETTKRKNRYLNRYTIFI